MMKLDFPRAPLVLALVLAPLLESSLRQSLLLSFGSPMIFVERPISAVLSVALVASLVWLVASALRQRRRRRGVASWLRGCCPPPSRRIWSLASTFPPTLRARTVATAEDLTAALLEAKEIHLPDPKLATAGIQFAKVMERLGIAARVAGAVRITAMKALARSQAARAIGCTQVTEIIITPGAARVAPLPAALGLATM